MTPHMAVLIHNLIFTGLEVKCLLHSIRLSTQDTREPKVNDSGPRLSYADFRCRYKTLLTSALVELLTDRRDQNRKSASQSPGLPLLSINLLIEICISFPEM